MSLNINPLPVQKVLDPRLEITTQREYTAVKGALVNSWQPFPATNVNNSSFQITCNPPSRDIAISRLIYKRVEFSWSVSGTNTSGGVLLNEDYFGPRAIPLTAVTLSEQITINNDTITAAPVRQYFRALLRYRNDWENRWGAFSLAPSMLDQFQSYEEGVGTNRNPLARNYGNNAFEQTRGSYVGFTIDPQIAGNTTATGRLVVYEPILISPFVFGNNANRFSCLAGVQNMSYNTTIGNLDRILSLVQDQGLPGQISLNTPVVNVESARLLFNFLTPDPIMPIPRNMESGYYSIVSYPTRTSVPVDPAGSPNDSVQITLQSVQVSSIPKRIYIFAKRDDSDETAFTTDTYFALNPDINPISITWDNNQFLNQASTQDLYNISVRNGCNMSYNQYVKDVGSVLALDFGIDIGLRSDQAAGVIGNYQLSVTANFKNTTNEAIAPTLYCVVVYEGVFNVNDGNCSHMIGVLSPSDVLNAPVAPVGSYQESQDVYGGKFQGMKGLVSGIKKGLAYAKKHHLASKMLKQLPMPQAQKLARAAEEMGYGLSGGELKGGDLNKIATKEKYNNKRISLSDLARDK